MIPEPTPEQAVRVLNILSAWTRRGWHYLPSRDALAEPLRIWIVRYTDPTTPAAGAERILPLTAFGSSPFDALCQATTVMQVLLSEHPETHE